MSKFKNQFISIRLEIIRKSIHIPFLQTRVSTLANPHTNYFDAESKLHSILVQGKNF